jgi:integrase
VETLNAKTAFGQSKHDAKKDETYTQHIYSYATFEAYLQTGCEFLNWVKPEYSVKTLEQAKPYVSEYLQLRIDRNLSAWTICKDAAALAKIYDCSAKDFGVDIPKRERADIKRSRGEEKTKESFCESKNQDFVDFCKNTGLRRDEVKMVTPQDVYKNHDTVFVHVASGKGGKERIVEALNSKVLDIAKNAAENGSARIFERIPAHADIHDYRSQYTVEAYNRIARDIATLPHKEIYFCRKERRGTNYDKGAMLIVSYNLGHNRVDVIGGNYLR